MPLLHHANRPLVALASDVTHDVYVCDQAGYRRGLLPDWVSLSYSRSTRDTGGITLEVPWDVGVSLREFAVFEVWRRVAGRSPRFVEVFIALSRPQGLGSRGTRFVSLSGPTMTGFVVGDKRIVAALPDTTLSDKTGPLDDVLKDYVSDAVLAAWDAASEGRNLATRLSISVASDQGQAAREQVEASLTTLPSVVKGIQARSEQSSAVPRRLFYRVRPVGFDPLSLRVETVMDCYGAYRGLNAARPVILSQETGTLGALDVEQDRGGEVNSVLVKYNDGTNDRLTRVTDAARSQFSALAFREGFYSASAATKTAAETEARYRLRQGEPRRMTRATVTSSATTRYGVDYFLGDVVGVAAFGRLWEAEVVAEIVGAGPPETVQLRLDEWSE